MVFVPVTRHALAALLAAAAAAPSLAEPTAARPDPLDPAARVPPAAHRSAFVEYRRQVIGPAVDWRSANDTVQRIGGWRAYAREAARPDTPASAPADVRRAP